MMIEVGFTAFLLCAIFGVVGFMCGYLYKIVKDADNNG